MELVFTIHPIAHSHTRSLILFFSLCTIIFRVLLTFFLSLPLQNYQKIFHKCYQPLRVLFRATAAATEKTSHSHRCYCVFCVVNKMPLVLFFCRLFFSFRRVLYLRLSLHELRRPEKNDNNLFVSLFKTALVRPMQIENAAHIWHARPLMCLAYAHTHPLAVHSIFS